MGKELLVIEDNEQNMYMVRFLLEQHGYEVIEAFDGRQGIELALLKHPQAILLDIQLPKIDGYQVARELKSQEALRKVPIIAVTSYAMAGDREKALAAGAYGYIEKPINPETFVSTVADFIQEFSLKGEGQT